MHPIQNALLALAQTQNLGTLTLREIGAQIGESLPQKIKHHLDQLQKKGLLIVDRDRDLIAPARSGLSPNSRLFSVPIVGAASCGPAVALAEGNIDGYLHVSEQMLPQLHRDRLFAVKAVGSSMNRADINGCNIEDGDYVIVDPEEKRPGPGIYVLSVIDGAANIKKMIQEPDRILLVSESFEEFPPIIIHPADEESYNYVINGKIAAVIKKPSHGSSGQP